MSKKHFEEFAAALALISDANERARVEALIADVCKRINPRFDRVRFTDAVEALVLRERPSGFSQERFREYMIEASH